MKLLIDGDIICYRAAFATEKTKYLVECHQPGWPDSLFERHDDAKSAKESPHGVEIWSRKDVQPVDQALMIASVMIKDIKEHFSSENPDTVVYLTGSSNFRNGIATRAAYKGNRSGTPAPVHLKAVREHLISTYGAIVSQNEEADDLLGIAMTADPGSVCVSIDGDLLQLPGRHYNFVTKTEVYIKPKAAVLNFYEQVLTGDSTDNVPGLTGIGPVKAGKALSGCRNPKECWAVCLDLYRKEFDSCGMMYAEECAKLVYVRRKVGEIWCPPTVQ